MAEEKTIALNRKALHDYFILEKVEAGLVLTGSEIKSLRAGKISLREGYAKSEAGELWLTNVHIARYDAGNRFNHDPLRPRKLLLHRREIDGLSAKVNEKGFTLVPLRVYIKDGLAKVELGLGRGKKEYDKREAIARKAAGREMERAMRRSFKG
ncbi:MAG: SsrA-binding protein SmpB [Chloroflexi bacterium]|nr:SsrA-binding protein SmpB [Chloroflexota bacterium]